MTFDTRNVISIEALATIGASLCGGVIQTTPYIGHPAYKAMGGRAAYTLATALFVGGAGLIGYFGLLFKFIPEAAVLPILIFIGIEITAQSFHATPRQTLRGAGDCLPAGPCQVDYDLCWPVCCLAELGYDACRCPSRPAKLDASSERAGRRVHSDQPDLGFCHGQDHRPPVRSRVHLYGRLLVCWFCLASCTHPWKVTKCFCLGTCWTSTGAFDAESTRVVLQFAIAYLVMSVLLFILGVTMAKSSPPISTDEEFENLEQ